MEGRIAKILNRMNEENAKLQECKKLYKCCQEARKAKELRISADWLECGVGGTKYRENTYLIIKGELKESVLDLIENHYIKLGKQHNEKLNLMAEEMKQE